MTAIFYILIVLFSVVIHEVAHGYLAYILGDPTAKMEGRLTLNPISHLDPVGSIFLPAILYFAGAPVIGWAKPVPYNPYNLQAGKWGPALVAAAGPASNIVIAVFFSILLRLNLANSFLSAAANEPMLIIIMLNLMLAIFNLIPVPPLDGSKILFSALPYKMRGVQAFFEAYGLFLVVFLLIFGGSFIFSAVRLAVRALTGV